MLSYLENNGFNYSKLQFISAMSPGKRNVYLKKNLSSPRVILSLLLGREEGREANIDAREKHCDWLPSYSLRLGIIRGPGISL